MILHAILNGRTALDVNVINFLGAEGPRGRLRPTDLNVQFSYWLGYSQRQAQALVSCIFASERANVVGQVIHTAE